MLKLLNSFQQSSISGVLGHFGVEVGGGFQAKILSFLQLFLDFDSWVLGIGDEFVLQLNNFRINFKITKCL